MFEVDLNQHVSAADAVRVRRNRFDSVIIFGSARIDGIGRRTDCPYSSDQSRARRSAQGFSRHP